MYVPAIAISRSLMSATVDIVVIVEVDAVDVVVDVGNLLDTVVVRVVARTLFLFLSFFLCP